MIYMFVCKNADNNTLSSLVQSIKESTKAVTIPLTWIKEQRACEEYYYSYSSSFYITSEIVNADYLIIDKLYCNGGLCGGSLKSLVHGEPYDHIREIGLGNKKRKLILVSNYVPSVFHPLDAALRARTRFIWIEK